MKIELLYFNGCPTYEIALQILNEVLKEEKIDAKIEMLKVKSNKEAKELKFLGSPTIRINGNDVERKAQESKDFGMRCRIYFYEGEIFGFPPKDMIRKAIGEAKK